VLVVYLAAYFVSLSLFFYMGVPVSVFYVFLLFFIAFVPSTETGDFIFTPLVALCSSIA
jgi:hypothetical protein